ncbi:MAG: hypothetical protein ACUZ8I_13305 [Candidatus Scalindua sp.]
MLEFFQKIFSQEFMPHGQCLFWKPEVLWLFVVSDGLITVSYFSIPFALIYFVYKRKDLMFKRVFILFGLFIIFCGITHLMCIWTLWHPMYRLEGAIKFLTAIVSMSTAVIIWPLIPKALALPSPAQLRDANQNLIQEVDERRHAENELQKAQLQLEMKVKERTTNLFEVNQKLEMEVSERKKMEQKLLELKDNLEIKVSKRTKELKEKLNELEIFHDATIDRELMIEEMRNKIEELEDRLKEKE